MQLLFKTHSFSIVKLVIGFSVLVYSCSPPVTFDRPQPPNSKELSAFPTRMQGSYLSQDSISVLTISDKGAIRTYDFALKISLDSAQKKYRLDGDTLTDLTTGKKELVILAGDTVLGRSSGIDTVFYISPANVLKKYKGYYFLNALYDKNAWTLRRLSLSGGILSISEIADTAHINQLKEITETPADTICTNFKMSQAQFRKFVRGNGFDQTEQFTRLSGR